MLLKVDEKSLKDLFFYNSLKDVLHIEVNGKHFSRGMRLSSINSLKSYAFKDEDDDLIGFKIINFSKIKPNILSFYLTKLYNYNFEINDIYMPPRIEEKKFFIFSLGNPSTEADFEYKIQPINEYLNRIVYINKGEEYLKGYQVTNMRLKNGFEVYKMIREDCNNLVTTELMNLPKFYKGIF